MKLSLRFAAVFALIVVPTAFASAGTVAYQTQVLSSTPYVYYRLDETSGPAAADTSGNARVGAYVNTPTFGVAGAGSPSDNAATFGGGAGGAYLGSANLAAFGPLLGNSSYEFVFKSTVTNAQMALGGVLNTGSVTGWELTVNRNAAGSLSAGGFRLFLRDDGGNASGGGFTALGAFDGNYHHVLFTYDKTGVDTASRMKAYLDGVPQTMTFASAGGNATPGSGTLSNFAFDTDFGARQNRATADLQFNGTLDEAALYTRTLTAEEAAAHAAAIPVPEPASLALLTIAILSLGICRTARARQDPVAT